MVRSVSAHGEARASVYDGRFMEDPVTLIPRSLFWRTLAVWALPLCALAADKTPSAPDPAHQGAALVAKAVEAYGGAAAVDSVSALEVRSSGTRHVQTDDLPVVTISRFFFPDRYYQELQMPMGTMKTVLGPKEAFIVAGEGSLPLPDAERKALLKLMQRNVLAVLRSRNQPGFTAVAKGEALVEGRATVMVDVTRDGDTVTLYVEPTTGQVRRTSFVNPAGGLGVAGEFVITYSDYRKGPAGPLVYPFNAVGTMAGQPAFNQRVESIVVNPKLDEAWFTPPPPHSMFPGADQLPLPSPSPAASPRPSPSPTATPK